MKKEVMMIAIALVAVISVSAAVYNSLKDTVQRPDPFASRSAEEAENVPTDAENAAEENEPAERIKAPDFTVLDAEGNSVKLSDIQGKPVVLNFWASWCPPCRDEMPEFNKVFEELGGDVQFMMVDAVDGRRETKEIGEEYIVENGYTFPVYYDIEQDAVRQYGIRAYPTSFFIDGEGYIVAGVEGAIDKATLRKGIVMISED